MLFNLSLVRHLTVFDSIPTGKLMMYRLYNWTLRCTERQLNCWAQMVVISAQNVARGQLLVKYPKC